MNRKIKLVSVQSRGVDITPGNRVDRWAESHIRPSLPIDPPVDYPVYEIRKELLGKHRFAFLDWFIIGLILALSFAGFVIIYFLISDPIGAGRISAGECYPPHCQVASIK